jgi:phosphate transport system substrate-binding protein
MKSTYVIIAAIVVIVIIIGGVFAYMYTSNPSNPTPTATPTSTATVSPTPTASSAATATPKASATPTSHPTSTPTATPSPTPAPTPGPASITASGATFPQPFLAATITSWQQIRTNVQINYQGGGSGKGVTDFTSKLVDFACSDAALTTTQTAALTSPAVQIPETIGAITIAYNLPGIATGLKLTGPIVADIYRGNITNWNDQRIAAINPGVSLPSNAITLVRRSDSSGTTNWFTKYLSSQSTTWNTQVGSGTAVSWPATTVGQSGNNGVAGYVEANGYTIGYVELAYALSNNMKVAAMQNSAGNYIPPTLASTTAAAASLPTSGLPTGSGDWSGVILLNAPGAQAYPIVNPTYMIVYKDLGVVPGMTIDKANQIVQYIWYVVHDGQSQAGTLQYASLPSNLVTIDEATLATITFNGQALVTH